jgi:hypothetical protein
VSGDPRPELPPPAATAAVVRAMTAETRRARDAAAAAARPPHLTSSGVAIPDIPSGTVLTLGPDEWSHCARLPPGVCLVMSVSRVHRTVTRQDEAGLWVWVIGHEQPRCGRTSTPAHLPCLHLMVRVDALTRAGRG